MHCFVNLSYSPSRFFEVPNIFRLLSFLKMFGLIYCGTFFPMVFGVWHYWNMQLPLETEVSD